LNDRIHALMLREFLRVAWGPVLFGVACLALAVQKWHGVLTPLMLLLAVFALIAGFVRMVRQSRGKISDNEVTRLPMDSERKSGASHFQGSMDD